MTCRRRAKGCGVFWATRRRCSRCTRAPRGCGCTSTSRHPSTLAGLGALNERFESRVPLDDTPPWRPPTYERPEHGHHAHAERVGRDWVGLSST